MELLSRFIPNLPGAPRIERSILGLGSEWHFRNPNIVDCTFTLATAYQAQNKFDEASAAYKKCLSMTPEFTEAREKLEELLRVNGKEAEADELAKQAPVDNNDSDKAEARKPEN